MSSLSSWLAALLAMLGFDVFTAVFHWNTQSQIAFVFMYLLYQTFRNRDHIQGKP
jgi:hypothetical protein